MEPAALAYCGTAPLPADLLRSWNLDPILIGIWVAFALVCGLCLQPTRKLRSRRRLFLAGWALALAAWISPLCALGVALFSGRVAQHMLLALAAAPLLACGWPRTGPSRARPALAAGAAFAAATWLWHAPVIYEATFRSSALYWAMHASLLAGAVAIWRVILSRSTSDLAIPCGLALATCFQMSLLGMIFAFAPAPLFTSHLLSAGPWGLTPLEDQQLGGLLIWIPGCGVFLVVVLALVAGWLKRLEFARRPTVESPS